VFEAGQVEPIRQLTWFDRDGRTLGTLGERGIHEFLELSPDDSHASVSILDPLRGTRDIWIFDLNRRVPTRFTSDPGNEMTSTWSASGSEIVFSAQKEITQDLYIGSSDGTGAIRGVVTGGTNEFSYGILPDGLLLFNTQVNIPPTGADIFTTSIHGGTPSTLIRTPANESQGRVSPNRRWVMFMSDEAGANDIYIAAFPSGAGKVRVSTDGGTAARWRGDGKEIFYLAGDGSLMAVEADSDSPQIKLGRSRALLTMRTGTGRVPYAVTRDGQRFLATVATDTEAAPTLTVISNWLGLQR
jgi:Tol biopolymer transport system component